MSVVLIGMLALPMVHCAPAPTCAAGQTGQVLPLYSGVEAWALAATFLRTPNAR